MQANKALGGDDDDASDDDIIQTLLELDYETCIDDEDEDEFAKFKLALESKQKVRHRGLGVLKGKLSVFML